MNMVFFAAFAAVTNGVVQPGVVTVYASRIDSVNEDIPAAVQVFDAAQIADSGAQDVPELLKKKAGMEVRVMNGTPVLASIAMRGFGDNAFGRVKVVLDGEELNNVDMSAPNLTRIPLGSVERVEVIHGPSPVLYGDGAVAGVVNVTTDTRDYEPLTRITAKAGSQYTFGSNMRTKGGDEEEGVLYNASYDYLQSDGYRDHNAYDMHTANSGVRKNFDNGSTVGLKVNYQNAYYELPGSLTRYGWKNARKSASTPDDHVRIWSYGFSVDSKANIAEDQWLYLDGGFSHQYGHPFFAGGTDYEHDYYSFRFSPRYVNERDIGDFGNKFTVGTDFRYDMRYEDGVYFGAPIDRRFNRDRYAAFIHDEFFLTDELSVIAGARMERIGNKWCRYDGLDKTRSHDWMQDYELGMVFRPVESIKTYVKGTQFHRSAFCDELSYTPDGRFLEPETGVSLDIGIEWGFLDHFTFMANGYGTVMEDEIFFDPALLPWGFNSNSPDRTRRVGLDTGLAWSREKVAEASVRYNIVHADFADGMYHGNDIPYVPNHRVRAEAGFWITDDLKIKGGSSYTGCRHVSGDYSNGYDELPAYTVFDFGVYYEPSWAEGLMASFVMDNLFDRNYCDYAGVGYYYPACGRSFMFTVGYEF